MFQGEPLGTQSPLRNSKMIPSIIHLGTKATQAPNSNQEILRASPRIVWLKDKIQMLWETAPKSQVTSFLLSRFLGHLISGLEATKHKNNVNSNPVHITVTAQVPQIHGRSQWIGHQHSKSQKTPQMSFSPESVEKDKNIQKESDEFFMVDIPHYFEQDQSVENTPRLTKEDEYLSAADYYSTLEELKNEKKIYKKQLEELQWYEKKFDEAEYHLESRKKYYQEAKNGIQNARNQRNKRFSLFPSD